MISTPVSRLVETAPACTDCQKRCAFPFGITAITRFLSRLQAARAIRESASIVSCFMGALDLNGTGRGPVLLVDYAAGYAVAGVTRRVGLQVVGFGVDYQGVAENGVIVIVHIDARIGDRFFRFALGIGGEIGHIAGVGALRIIEAVLLLIGIEVRAGA